MEDDKPEVTDVETDDLFEENVETGGEDVEGKSEDSLENLTLDEINKVSGREFKSKEEYLKHYENLKSLVGDQEAAKERKSKQAGKSEETDKLSALEAELASMKQESTRDKFLAKNPTANGLVDIIEAYAEKNGLTLDEAFDQKFKDLAESSQRKVINQKNRQTPVQTQKITDLADRARQGDPNATEELVGEIIWKK